MEGTSFSGKGYQAQNMVLFRIISLTQSNSQLNCNEFPVHGFEFFKCEKPHASWGNQNE